MKLNEIALDRASDAIWKRLDPKDEIGRCGIIPNRFNDAAELAVKAYLDALPADDALIEKIESFAAEAEKDNMYTPEYYAALSDILRIIRQHQSGEEIMIFKDAQIARLESENAQLKSEIDFLDSKLSEYQIHMPKL